MRQNLGARPLFRIVVIGGMPVLLEMDETSGDDFKMPDGSKIRIGELFVLGLGTCFVHFAMIKGARKG